MRSSGPIVSKIVLSCLVLSCLVILSFYMRKQIDYVIGFAKIILDVVIFSRDAELFKFIFERSALLEKTVNFSIYLHL